MVLIKPFTQEEYESVKKEIKRKYANYCRNIREQANELEDAGLKASPLGMHLFGEKYRSDCFFCGTNLERIAGPHGGTNENDEMIWNGIFQCNPCDVRYFLPESEDVQKQLTESFNNNERNICSSGNFCADLK